jgi:hypothetical protein
MTCYGDDDETCPLPLRVEVSPNQVNIDSGGVDHYVRVLTYAWYRETAEAFVYINDNIDPIDSEYIILTRDSVGHLVIKIDLIAFQEAYKKEQLDVDSYNELKIAVVLKSDSNESDECLEKEGIGQLYIIGKKNAVSR